MFNKIISAFVYSLVQRKTINKNDAVRFVIRQYNRTPDLYRVPIFIITIIFNFYVLAVRGSFFYRLTPEQRFDIIKKCKRSRIGIIRDFIKYYDSIVMLYTYSQSS